MGKIRETAEQPPSEEELIKTAQGVVKNILAGDRIGWNNALSWAADWIEGQLQGETNERTIEFGKNMAMSLRAARKADLASR